MHYHTARYANSITSLVMIVDYVKSATSVRSVKMSEPSYLSGDTLSRSTAYEGSQEVECGECGELAEVTTTEEYSHGETTWYAEWICVCGESNSAEGWYDPNFTD